MGLSTNNGRRKLNQKCMTGNFSNQLFGQSGVTNVPMKTTTGTSFEERGATDAIIVLPKQTKTVNGI